MKKTGIVVLNYKNYADTLECLESLQALDYADHEIVVVDNDSQNDSLSHIGSWLAGRNVAYALFEEGQIGDATDRAAEKTILIQSRSNRGYSAGNNLGIRVALGRQADYVLILNNDTIVEKGFVQPLVDCAESDERIGVVGPKTTRPDGKLDLGCARRRPGLPDFFFRRGINGILFPNNRWIKSHFYTGEYAFDRPREVDLVSGSCMLIKRCVFEKVGLLDENVFLYAEEFILHEKLRSLGMKTVVVPESRIVHKYARSTRLRGDAFMANASTESMLYYLVRYRRFNRLIVYLIIAYLWLSTQLTTVGLFVRNVMRQIKQRLRAWLCRFAGRPDLPKSPGNPP